MIKGRKLHPKLGIPEELRYDDIIAHTRYYIVDIYNAMIKLYDELDKKREEENPR